MMDQKVGKKQLLIAGGFILVLVPAIWFAVVTFTKPQSTPKTASVPVPTSNATQTTTTGANAHTSTAQAVCNPPGQVQNVQVNYPNCQ